MRIILLSTMAMLVGCSVPLGASESIVKDFPEILSVDGVQYRFDQPVLEKSLSKLSGDLARESKAEPSHRDAAKVRTLKLHLTLAIAAAGHYANANGEIKLILKSITDNLDLANEPAPQGFLGPRSLFFGMASQAFVDSQGTPPDINIELMGEVNFGRLAANAYRMIEIRSSPKIP